MKYVILGDPTPLARPRFAQTPSGKPRIWDIQREIKVNTGITLKGQHEDRPFFKAPIALQLMFYFPIPINHRKGTIKEGDFYLHRPDLDNLEKFIIDIGTGILYEDDRYIVKIQSEKIYSLQPRTEISIRTLSLKERFVSFIGKILPENNNE